MRHDSESRRVCGIHSLVCGPQRWQMTVLWEGKERESHGISVAPRKDSAGRCLTFVVACASFFATRLPASAMYQPTLSLIDGFTTCQDTPNHIVYSATFHIQAVLVCLAERERCVQCACAQEGDLPRPSVRGSVLLQEPGLHLPAAKRRAFLPAGGHHCDG